MTFPKVSVVMSVHNGERYLGEAVDSILNQTFRDFEFIIIDDGSTDGTASILDGYTDPRITTLRNETNIGLTRSLNRGVATAQGEYIARMDADDVSMPERLARQVAHLDGHPHCCVVAAKIINIDRTGKSLGSLPEDRRATTADEIRQELPRINCIAHPSVMIRTSVAKEYLYDEHLRHAQDYELWLRLCSDGKTIDKVDETLLSRRVHPLAISSRTRPEGKNIRVKTVFLRGRVARFKLNRFDLKVFIHFLWDLSLLTATSAAQILQRVTVLLGRLVLVSFGRLVGLILPWKNRSSLFFFFPFYQVGGGERVQADIVNCVADQKPWIVFCDRSKDAKFKPLFQKGGASLFDISSLTKNRITFHVCAGVLATLINRHPNAVVFGSNTQIFYHLVRYLKPNVRRIELLHAFGGGVEKLSLRVIHQIDTRVVINRQTFQDLEEQYAANNVGSELIKRVVLIENQVPVPDSYPQKQEDDHLRVLFVGRCAPEKRIHLVGKAATRCHEIGIPVEFTLVGDVVGAIDVEDRSHCVFAGEIAELAQLERLYDEADVIVLTSSREGFPMVIMEGMAHGVVPVATSVGGIPFHVKHKVNGMLIGDDDENSIVCSLAETLQELASDRALLRCLSQAAYNYAREHFAPATFCETYRQLILGPAKS